MNKRTLGVAAVFLVGCAVGGVSSHLTVPKASAQQAAALTKWETHCLTSAWDEFTNKANEAGTQGWELVSFTRTGEIMGCFKRPKM